ncbi:MAG: hypothetical protein HC876_20030, partial [Chloroflexaceae bacterium]|nr:hypothetical protein [Chloroflexaceae bacterium]
MLYAPQTLQTTLDLDAVTTEAPALLRVAVWAASEAPANPDHRLLVRVNGQQVGLAEWDGRGATFFDSAVPPGVLVAGSNSIELDAPGDTAAPLDSIGIDWLELHYARPPVATDERLTFTGTGALLELLGLQSDAVAVYNITAPYSATLELRTAGGAPLGFTGAAEQRYAAVGTGGYRTPTRLEPVTTAPAISVTSDGADYLAIGAPELLEAVGPLLDYHTANGLTTLALPWEAVVNEFHGGMPEPAAIRALLQHARQHWQRVPSYLLLVGDATYDPRGYVDAPPPHMLP